MIVTDLSAERIKRSKVNGLPLVGRASKNSAKQKKSCSTDKPKVSPYEASATLELARHDARTKTGVELQRLYPGTFQCWKNMKYDRQGALIADEFKTFKGFLATMGPRRHSEYTLDRLNPYDPEYSASKCRWADKTEQANNRRSTKMLAHPLTGDPTPLTEVAKLRGVKPDTLRKRVRKGSVPALSRPALIPPDPDPRKRWPWHLKPEQFKKWEESFKADRITDMPDAAGGTGYEWPFEFALRWAKLFLQAERNRAERIIRDYDDFEQSAPEDVVQDYRDAMVKVRHYYERVKQAEVAFSTWKREMVGIPRKRPRPAYD